MEAQEGRWKCAKCGCGLVQKRTTLSYLGYSVDHDVPVCPKCGKVYIPESLAEGRMSEVEQLLEDK